MSVRKLREDIEALLESKIRDVLSSVFEYRFVKVVASSEGYEYSYWAYLGARSDYLIIPTYFCSCKDFIIRTVINKTTPCCKHVLGQYLAMKRGKYVIVRTSIQESDKIVSELVSKSFSPTLRRLIYTSKVKNVPGNDSSP